MLRTSCTRSAWARGAGAAPMAARWYVCALLSLAGGDNPYGQEISKSDDKAEEMKEFMKGCYWSYRTQVPRRLAKVC